MFLLWFLAPLLLFWTGNVAHLYLFTDIYSFLSPKENKRSNKSVSMILFHIRPVYVHVLLISGDMFFFS